MSLLPTISTLNDYRHFISDRMSGLKALLHICRCHGYPEEMPARYEDGSTVVAQLGHNRVVKLFAPMFRDGFDIERRALTLIDGSLPIPTPKVLDVGEVEGWPYIVMEEMPGLQLHRVWDQIDRRDQVRFSTHIGETLRQLHRFQLQEPSHDTLSPDGPPLELPAWDWDHFLQKQAAGCVARQRSNGVDEHWLRQIPGFLERTDLTSDRPGLVLLHTEVMREHLLARIDGNEPTLSGLIDFEPAMSGAAEYEFASVGLFVSKGDSRALRALLKGYGYHDDELNQDLQYRFMAYALLHRYSNLSWYLQFMPAGSTLEELAAAWWSFD